MVAMALAELKNKETNKIKNTYGILFPNPLLKLFIIFPFINVAVVVVIFYLNHGDNVSSYFASIFNLDIF